jgi:hypothetical protein
MKEGAERCAATQVAAPSGLAQPSSAFSFLRRNGLTGMPDQFDEVVVVLRKFFEPVLREV